MQLPGLSDRFLQALDQARLKLESNPQHYSQYQNTDLRAISVRQFPFQLVFLLHEQMVTIVSVRHTSRKPYTD